jgi:hypothetical protein
MRYKGELTNDLVLNLKGRRAGWGGSIGFIPPLTRFSPSYRLVIRVGDRHNLKTANGTNVRFSLNRKNVVSAISLKNM